MSGVRISLPAPFYRRFEMSVLKISPWQRSMTIAQALCAAQDGLCFYCGREFTGPAGQQKIGAAEPNNWTRDHLRSRSNGHGTPKNIVLACSRCNQDKKDEDATDEQLRRAEIVHSRAVYLLRVFNGTVPHEWV